MNENELQKLRGELRSIDSVLVDTLAQRMRLVSKIGLLKQELNMPVIDTAAEKSTIDNITTRATEVGLEEPYARRLAELIIGGSVDVQTRSRPPTASSDSILKQLFETVQNMEKEGRELVRLDIGEPRFNTPAAALREAQRCLGESPQIFYGSSAGLPELADAIAARLNDQYKADLRRSNVLIVPGGRFGIFAAIQTTVSSFERVVICQPAWPAYESFATMLGARVCPVSTGLENRWDVDLASLEEALKLRPKLLILNSPNNPTGKVLSAKMFRELTELAAQYSTTVLSDEVYASYCSSRVPSVLEHADCESIHINSFSKEFGMTGWRVAYVVADEQKIMKMRSLLQRTITNVPEFVQRAAFAALTDQSGEAQSSRQEIARRVEMACELLKKAGLEFCAPDGGFYVFPRIAPESVDAGKFAEHLLHNHGVSVVPGTIFGRYSNFMRLSITETEPAVRTGIERIVKAMHEWPER